MEGKWKRVFGKFFEDSHSLSVEPISSIYARRSHLNPWDISVQKFSKTYEIKLGSKACQLQELVNRSAQMVKMNLKERKQKMRSIESLSYPFFRGERGNGQSRGLETKNYGLFAHSAVKIPLRFSNKSDLPPLAAAHEIFASF